MRTLVVSDTHLGAGAGNDVLRHAELREPLIAALDGVDRLVLLGDAIELRERPVARALADARPVLEALGRALGDRPVVVVPGNHDYQLISPWLERRASGLDGTPEPLGIEQVVAPQDVSPLVAEVAGWLAPARLSFAYPGLWLEEGVYATHGHYLDLHATVPSFERLAARVVRRVLGGAGETDTVGAGAVAAYEAVLAPIYALLYSVAQSAAGERGLAVAGVSGQAWKLLRGSSSNRRLRWMLAGAVGLPVTVAALNRAGLGPLSANLSGPELRRSGLRAMAEVVRRLGVDARHVVFGHTHRAGPFPSDPADEWLAPGGARLINAGSWLYDAAFVGRSGHDSPYWPGTAVLIEDDRPPELKMLLADRSHAELRGS